MLQFNEMELFPVWSRILAFLSLRCLMNMERACRKMQYYVHTVYRIADCSIFGRAFAPGCPEFERILTLKFGASYVSDMSESHPSFRPIVQAFSNVADRHLINQSDLITHNYRMKLSATVMVDLTELASAKHLQKLRLKDLMNTDDFGVPVSGFFLVYDNSRHDSSRHDFLSSTRDTTIRDMTHRIVSWPVKNNDMHDMIMIWYRRRVSNLIW